MHSTTALIPRQRPAEPCPPGCHGDHHGERPGQICHWQPIATIPAELAPRLCVDLSQMNGLTPLITLHDADGHHTPLTLDEAAAYGRAILAAVAQGVTWTKAAGR